ncbi:hypothetical protein [Pontibacter sp. SGAir0037]|uniref:hypothetical protein n=1 Tax=Pontibacter sp. SGAir0037 TaxID=2571030 RepID=UPI0010CCEDB4|nr:hypothetical protein [Pontibacter sp. SGAir0037]QCR21629.1 hypothetical protein C1N53_04225 [Pontibacter sp. SGAir0037]
MKSRRTICRPVPATYANVTVIFLLLSLLLIGQFSFGQVQEFKKNSNGLLYGEETIGQLKFIVDSLNLKFKTCELHKTYLSKAQTHAHFVRLEEGNVKGAQRDLERQMPLEEFLLRYPKATIDKDLLLVRSTYTNYDGQKVLEFSSVPFDETGAYNISFKESTHQYENPIKGRWIISYLPASVYSAESLAAFYLLEELKLQPLPLKYARMVQYSNYMVDTTTQIFLEKANAFRQSPKKPEAVTQFLNFVHQETDKPEPGKRMTESRLVQQDKFQMLMAAAVEAALEKGGSDDELEEYAAHFYSKKAALELKRGRQVVGTCSMDDSPRIHALNIAMLSAESAHWETFLRAHLDIMNDRFDRASDGSYAWAGRKTYIRELEVLDINVPDLLFGISMRIDNAEKTHYNGNISRLGRALSETAQSEKIQQAMFDIISDQQLDDYNRILMYYLFLNYNYHLEDKSLQKKNLATLNKAVKT